MFFVSFGIFFCRAVLLGSHFLLDINLLLFLHFLSLNVRLIVLIYLLQYDSESFVKFFHFILLFIVEIIRLGGKVIKNFRFELDEPNILSGHNTLHILFLGKLCFGSEVIDIIQDDDVGIHGREHILLLVCFLIVHFSFEDICRLDRNSVRELNLLIL